MSRVTQISNYASHVMMVRNVSLNQNVINDLSAQMASGKKSVDLQYYGKDSKEILDLRATAVQRQAFVHNINTVTPRLKAYDKVMTRLEDIATELTANTVFPNGPGPARTSVVNDADPKKMKVAVNTDGSTFTQKATYTVTATPSPEGRPNTFDITVSDGLGGSAIRTVELAAVPPADGYRYNFKINGGPGEGTTLNLTFENLVSASASRFDVSWPETEGTRERVEGTFSEIRALLNERMGDRYLFSGSRLATEPVAAPAPAKQVSRVTLNGGVGEAGETYSVTVNGKRFAYVTQGRDGAVPEPDMHYIAQKLADQVNAATPGLPVIASVGTGNIITLTARTPEESFTVAADVVNRAETLNSASHLGVTQQATSALPQVSSLKFNGPDIDVGDRFGITVTYSQPGLWDHAIYNIPWQVTDTNVHDLPEMSRMDMATTRLAEEINKQYPPLPFSARVSGEPGDLRLEVVGRENGKAFTIEPNSNINGNIVNTVTVATLPRGTTSAINDTNVVSPYLPDYDSQYNPDFPNRPNPAAWDKASIDPQTGMTVEYGLTSTDPAFQKLIRAFRYARAAVDKPGDYTELMKKTKSLLAEAKSELRALHAKVSVDSASLESVSTAHQKELEEVSARLSGIEGIDQTEVAARLQQSMNTVEASYTIAGRTNRLSLVNFLT